MAQKGVRTENPQYSANAGLWQRCDDCVEGEHRIHSRGMAYLPKLTEEEPIDYNARLKRTPFFNAFWRTVSGLKGTMFRKSPMLMAPIAVAESLQDADMAGTPLDAMAQELAQEILTTGRVGLLVDYPQINLSSEMTQADFDRMGLRPFLAIYKADSILNWKSARIGNKLTTTMVVLRESASLPGSDEFAQDSETRYRVLDLTPEGYRVRVFRINERDEDELVSESFPLMSGQPMTEIPFVVFGHDSLLWTVSSPPLLDLAELNLHHYQVSADYEHGCHFSGLPTPFIAGLQLEDGQRIRIGSKTAIVCPDPQATGSYMEVTGDFAALRSNLDSKKAEMAVLGARMLESQKASVEAADTLKQRQAGEQSQLAAMADVLSMGITRALGWFAAWMRASGDVKYQINKDFVPVGMTAQELTAMVSAWQAGAMSDQTLYSNLQAGEIADANITFEEEQERIAASGPRLINGN
jgi:hypothetical protein